MATFTPKRLRGTLKGTVTIADSANDTCDLDLDTQDVYDADFQILFDIASGSPDGDFTITFYGSSSGGAADLDTEPMLPPIKLNFTATGQKRISVRGFRMGYIRCKGENDTGASGNWTVKWEGRQQESA